MDGERFDRLAKAFATGMTRRRVLSRLVGGGVALGSTAGAQARVQCRPLGTKCSQDDQCCGGVCLDRVCGATCPNDCSGYGTCDLTTGTCTCDYGFTGVDCATQCYVTVPCDPFCDTVCCPGPSGQLGYYCPNGAGTCVCR